MQWGEPWNGFGMRGNSSRLLQLRGVAAAAFRPATPICFHGSAQSAQQRGLVELRREQVVAAALVQVVGVVTVGVDGVL